MEKNKSNDELTEKRKFFTQKMSDTLKALTIIKSQGMVDTTETQEKCYLSQIALENEQKENSRLRLYLQRCKEDIDRQFPKVF